MSNPITDQISELKKLKILIQKTDEANNLRKQNLNSGTILSVLTDEWYQKALDALCRHPLYMSYLFSEIQI